MAYVTTQTVYGQTTYHSLYFHIFVILTYYLQRHPVLMVLCVIYIKETKRRVREGFYHV